MVSPASQVRAINGDSVLQSLDGRLPTAVAGPCLIMLVGLPGSGKSTLARRLAPAIGAAVLESDALRWRLFQHPDHSPEESALLFAAIHEAMEQLLLQGHSVILDATNLREQDRRPVEAIARKAGARLLTVWVIAPAATIEARLRRRATEDPTRAGIDVYLRMTRSFEPPAPTEHLRVDTSDAEFYESALQQIIREANKVATPRRNRPDGRVEKCE